MDERGVTGDEERECCLETLVVSKQYAEFTFHDGSFID
jgi:hypothetical protein